MGRMTPRFHKIFEEHWTMLIDRSNLTSPPFLVSEGIPLEGPVGISRAFEDSTLMELSLMQSHLIFVDDF
jgi:hypothetical protein